LPPRERPRDLCERIKKTKEGETEATDRRRNQLAPAKGASLCGPNRPEKNQAIESTQTKKPTDAQKTEPKKCHKLFYRNGGLAGIIHATRQHHGPIGSTIERKDQHQEKGTHPTDVLQAADS